MYQLTSPIRGYAWGSREVIAGLQRRPAPTAAPEAELWIGAHLTAPSLLPDGSSLADLIENAPLRMLGEAAAARFGPRLPYLMKVLAAEEPLSLQAHPDLGQAMAGYAAGNPNYVDGNHKPELLVALTPMDALCGFRDPGLSAHRLATLELPELTDVIAMLRGRDLRAAVETLLTWPGEWRRDLIADVLKSARLMPRADAAVVENLAGFYPDDMGVLVALLLNHVTVQPGEALWMPAGNLHSYQRGAGIEIMAASDNVLRGGLTPKRIDVPELLRVVRFEPLDAPLVPMAELAPGVVTWPVPVSDFALRRITVAGEQRVLEVAGPRTVLCSSGKVTVRDASGEVMLASGDSAFGPADGGPLHISGTGQLFLATPGA
jgi:mannose-6-phosphate isomerase